MTIHRVIIFSMAMTVALGAAPAFAHVGHGMTSGLAAGILHPLSGLDHLAAMLTVGLWAALKGGRALWMWPAAFVAIMLIGGACGMAGVPLPMAEPAIIASLVVLGLLVALAVDLPLAVGAFLIGAFALFHGYAHGSEAPEAASGATYLLGFAMTTAALHGLGIAGAFVAAHLNARPFIRIAGAACMALGIVLAIQLA